MDFEGAMVVTYLMHSGRQFGDCKPNWGAVPGSPATVWKRLNQGGLWWMILKGTLEPSVSVSSTVTWLEVLSSPFCRCEVLQNLRAACGCPPSKPASAPGAGGGVCTEKKGSSRPHSKLELLCLVSPCLHTPPTATSCPERRRCDLGA